MQLKSNHKTRNREESPLPSETLQIKGTPKVPITKRWRKRVEKIELNRCQHRITSSTRKIKWKKKPTQNEKIDGNAEAGPYNRHNATFFCYNRITLHWRMKAVGLSLLFLGLFEPISPSFLIFLRFYPLLFRIFFVQFYSKFIEKR